jgi:hypothetical protein
MANKSTFTASTTTTAKPTATTTTTGAPKNATDPVQDENLAANDVPKQAANRHPVTGDASLDASPEGDGGDIKETPKKTPRDKADVDVGPYIQEPSGATDAAVRERENTEFKNAMPPDRTPDKVEQKINEAAGVGTQGSPPPAPAPGAGQAVSGKEDTETTFHRRFHDSASGAAVDRYRQEIIQGASGKVTRIKETVDPPLDQPTDDGLRTWKFVLSIGK